MDAQDLSIEVARLSLKPDDILIVRAGASWTVQMMREYAQYLNQHEAFRGLAGRIHVAPHDVEMLVVGKDEAA